MFILKKGHQPGVYVPLRALFLVIRKWRIHFSLEGYSHSKSQHFIHHQIMKLSYTNHKSHDIHKDILKCQCWLNGSHSNLAFVMMLTKAIILC